MGILVVLAASAVFFAGTCCPLHAFGKKDMGKDSIIYTHKKHADKYKVGDCETCHRNITKSKRSALDHYSFQEGCSGIGCHNVKNQDSCSVCHTNVKGRTPAKPFREVVFSHKGHFDEKIECLTCHAEIDTQRIFDRTRLPSMMICLNCHSKKGKTMKCNSCHTDLGLANSHSVNWETEHGKDFRENRQKCQVCHSPSHCDRCHSGKNLPFIHPANYEYTHGSDVLGGGGDCRTCHSNTAFCDRCHRAKWGREAGKHSGYVRGSKSCKECHDD